VERQATGKVAVIQATENGSLNCSRHRRTATKSSVQDGQPTLKRITNMHALYSYCAAQLRPRTYRYRLSMYRPWRSEMTLYVYVEYPCGPDQVDYCHAHVSVLVF
jgi:hypothetical protein